MRDVSTCRRTFEHPDVLSSSHSLNLLEPFHPGPLLFVFCQHLQAWKQTRNNNTLYPRSLSNGGKS